MRPNQQFVLVSIASAWDVVALDSASGEERWRLSLGVSSRQLASIAPLAGRRLAVLQAESNHLRYREFDVSTGTLLREQTDDCGGELCGCETIICRPRNIRTGAVTPPAQTLHAVAGRLRARLATLQAGAGWGTSVLRSEEHTSEL